MESALKTSEFDVEDVSPARTGDLRDGPVSIEWDVASASEWDSACESAPFAAYQQSHAYGEAMAQLGRRIVRARAVRADECLAIAQIEIRKLFGVLTLAHVMRGPVWTVPDITEAEKIAVVDAIRADLPVKGLHAFVVLPEGDGDDFLKHAGYKCVFSGYHTAFLDLTPDEDALLAGLNGKWRNRLKAAEKAQMTITPIAKRPEKYEWLLDKEDDRQRTRGYRAPDAAMTPIYQSIVGKRSIIAFEAKQGTERIGGMLFLKHGDGATYHVGWASDEGKSVNVHNRLLWHSIKALKKAGVKVLDLGGVNTDFNPGIARFKLGVGARVVSLSGAWTKGPRWK